MSKIFDLNNPVMQALNTMADLIILNLLTLLCCIPVFTIGASLSAMHYVLLKMARKEESYIVKPFFKAFKDNFKQATGEWLICLLIFAVLIVDAVLIRDNSSVFPSFLGPVILALIAIMFLFFQWIFPLQMHFVNPVKVTLKNAVFIAIAKFPRTLGMAAIWAVPVLVLYLSTALVPLVVMFGLTAPGLVMAHLYSPVFKTWEPEEEPMPTDADFHVSDEDAEEAISSMQEIQEENRRIEEQLRNGTYRSETQKAADDGDVKDTKDTDQPGEKK